MPISVDQWRDVRLMATSVAAAIEQARARYVLITSPTLGDGKSLFVRALEHEFHSMAMTRFHFVPWGDLAQYQPQLPDDQSIVLVDGPALGEGDGVLRLPPDWLHAFDGALIIVKKRVTRRIELEQAVAWLKATGIAPIGVIWNEHGLPPLAEVLRGVRGRITKFRERKPAPEAEASVPQPVTPRKTATAAPRTVGEES